MTILLDGREGSWQLAKHEPLRSLLPPCPACSGRGKQLTHPTTYAGDGRAAILECQPCKGTGRQLSHITTHRGEGGPDVLIVGQGPESPLLIAIEVKRLSDLLQSAHTGRLQAQDTGQLQVMTECYSQSWLLTYGAYRPTGDGGIEVPHGREWRPLTYNGNPDGKPIQNAYQFLERMRVSVAALGVLTCHVSNEKEAARWIVEALYGWWSKPWDEHSFTKVFKSPPRLPLSIPGLTAQQHTRAKRLLGDWPGLGPDRAIAAAKHFPSVLEMAQADEKEWMKVPGIGKGIAGHLVKAFRS